MTRALRAITAGVVLTLLAGSADAQCTATAFPSNCALTRSWSVVVQRTVRITITPTVATFPSPDATAFTNGFSVAFGHTAVVKANGAWEMLISSGQAVWTAGGGGRANKPQADLLWGLSSGGSFAPLTSSPVQVATGSATNSTSVSIYYKVLWAWNLDTPGVYTLPITLTISAP